MTTRTPTSTSTAAASSRSSRRAGAEPGGEGRLREHAADLRPAAVPAGRRAAPDRARRPRTASTRRRARATTSSTARSTGCATSRAAADEHLRPAHARARTPGRRSSAPGCGWRSQGEELLVFGDGTPAARLHLRRRRGRRVPPRRRARRGRRRVFNLGGDEPVSLARARRAARRLARRRLVPARALPRRPQGDRHRRLLRATTAKIRERARLGAAVAARGRPRAVARLLPRARRALLGRR